MPSSSYASCGIPLDYEHNRQTSAPTVVAKFRTAHIYAVVLGLVGKFPEVTVLQVHERHGPDDGYKVDAIEPAVFRVEPKS